MRDDVPGCLSRNVQPHGGDRQFGADLLLDLPMLVASARGGSSMPERRAGLRRFLVTWRDGQERPVIHDVGCLSYDGAYHFRYLDSARTAPGFRPLPGLPDLLASYGPAADLFPVFAGGSWSAPGPTSRPT